MAEHGLLASAPWKQLLKHRHDFLVMAKEFNPDLAGHDGASRVKLHFRALEKDGEVSAEKIVTVPSGVSAFDAASWNGIAIDSTCGGYGTCKKCKIQITDGSVEPSKLDFRAFTPDEIQNGWRLACMVRTTKDISIDVPPLTTRPKAATVGVGRQIILRPGIQKRYVELSEPTLSDQRTDIVRLLEAIEDIEPTYSLNILRELPTVLRKNNFKVTAVFADQELIAIEGGDTSEIRFGIAFDLGTTTVVATLIDLNTGAPAAVKSILNKQQPLVQMSSLE